MAKSWSDAWQEAKEIRDVDKPGSIILGTLLWILIFFIPWVFLQ
jgi:hypothetical protein